MSRLTEIDVAQLVGVASPLILGELLRTGASVAELRRAAAIVASGCPVRGRPSTRLRRLVDLIGAIETATPVDHAS